MHRYVALVRRHGGDARFQSCCERIGEVLPTWVGALKTEQVAVWSKVESPSRLGVFPIGRGACLIGRAFPRLPDPGSLNWPKPGVGPLAPPYWGPYVAIQTDPAHGTSIGRDPSGRIECWRYDLGWGELVFSHLADVVDLLPRPPQANSDYIAHYLGSHWMHGSETAICGLFEILPGFARIYPGEGLPTDTMWWRPDRIANDSFESRARAQVEIRKAAEEVVIQWSRPYGSIVLDLSGGLDSSITLGLLSKVARHSGVQCLNYVFEHAEGDELAFARTAASFNDSPLHPFEVSRLSDGPPTPFTGRLMRPGPRVLSAAREAAYIDKTLELGADAFFTGSGGDHLFGKGVGIESLRDHRRRHGLGGETLAVAHQLARLKGQPVWTVLREGLRQGDTLREVADVTTTFNPFADQEVQAGVDRARFAHPWVHLAASSVGPGKRRQILHLFELDRHHLRYGRADVAEEVHPLVSQPLMEACLRTPAYWLSDRGVQRNLARSAFGDILPSTIAERRSKGRSSSYWLKVLSEHLDTVRPQLLEGALARMGLLDRAKVERALHPLRIAAEKDFGSLLICLTAELWLKQDLFTRASRPAAP